MADARSHLMECLTRRGLPGPGKPFPLATLEEFFTGNEDDSSIGINLEPHPGLKCFYELLLDLRARPEVQDVLVEISEVDASDPERWPATEQIYVLTSAEREDLEEWLAPLEPDAIVEGFHDHPPDSLQPAAVPGAGMRVWGVWWD